MKPMTKAVTTTVLITIFVLVLIVQFTVTNYFEKNNVAFLNEKLIEEFKNKKIKEIEYIAAIDENGDNIKIPFHSNGVDLQHSENSEKKRESSSDHIGSLNVLNQQLFALPVLCTTIRDLAPGEPKGCLAVKYKFGYALGDGTWIPDHCHCQLPEGKR